MFERAFKLLFIFIFIYYNYALADPCQDIVFKIVKPPPAVKLLLEGRNTYYVDAKERQELLSQFRRDSQQVVELISKYIETRRRVEEIKKYLSWQWGRVEVGVEYKKDIWRQQIELTAHEQELKGIERQLLLLGATKRDLEACYKYSWQ
jgi:hypothetical protein